MPIDLSSGLISNDRIKQPFIVLGDQDSGIIHKVGVNENFSLLHGGVKRNRDVSYVFIRSPQAAEVSLLYGV